MAITQGEGSETGGGSAQSMCEISPADEISIINNLMSRIKTLELTVSQLLASNVRANQLSDISQQVGWVYDITYMGIPGWTQTSAGTLIPPPGVTFSDIGLGELTDYPCNPYDSDGQIKELRMSVYDSDGQLNFGTGCKGQLFGSKVDTWDAGGARDYYVFKLNDDIDQGRGISIGANTYSTGAGVYSGGARFTVTKEGLYLVNQSATWIFSGGTAANTLLAAKGDLQGGTVGLPSKWLTRNNEIEWIKTIVGQTFQDPIGDLLHLNQTELFLLDVGNRVTSSMTAYALPGANLPADIHFQRVNFSIVHLTTTA